MAKRRKTVAFVDDDPPELADETEGAAEQHDFTDVLGAAVAEVGANIEDAVVRIERINREKKLEYVGELPAAGFELKEVQQTFGGGEYHLSGRVRGRIAFRRRVHIADLPRAVAPPPPTIEPVAEALKQLAEQQKQLMVVLAQRQDAAPTVDRDAVRRDLLQDMALMKTLMGGGSAGPEKMFEVLRAGIDLAKEVQGGGEGDWTTVLTKALDVFGKPVAGVIERATTATAPPTTPAGIAVNGGAAAQPALPAKPKQDRGGNVKQYIAFLVERAASGADPELYAELVLDNVPDAMLRPLLAGDVVARLAALDSRVNQHAQWFRDLGAIVQEALNADAAGPGSESPAGDGNPGGPT